MTIPALPSYSMPSEAITNRVNWLPDASRAIVLIHDMQEYFLAKYDMQAAPIPELIANARRLRDLCDAAAIPVFYTAQPTEQPPSDRALLNDFWGPGLTAPEVQAQQPIVPELQPRPDDQVLTKWRYSAFQRSDLRQRMRELGRDQIIICGVYAHIGCMSTALEAFMQDVQPFMVIDALADFSRENHMMAINYVAQRCGVALTLSQITQAINSAR
jgi:bifunctional isochorismate lyase/aryl carrier protein